LNLKFINRNTFFVTGNKLDVARSPVCGPNFLLSHFPSNFFSPTHSLPKLFYITTLSHHPEKVEIEAHFNDKLIHSFSHPQLPRRASKPPPAQHSLPTNRAPAQQLVDSLSL
jgi:hypothetical protein